jgi:hypothetical protein
MNRAFPLSLIVAWVAFAGSVRAQAPVTADYPGLETGKMWTFDVPPLEYWAKRYGFRPDPAWLEHARLSAARLPGCSASFVSGDGLVMTNHHCARGCIASSTKPGEDLLENGFYARARGEERPCEGMTLDQLEEITDVTDSVNAAVPAGTAATQAADLRRAAGLRLERACAAPGAFCQVVPMYRGGQYKLYRFRRFSDVRLVFAVEAQIGFFGGDPDNFTYPRHDLDLTFLRAYENGQPARTTHHYRWSRSGSSEGDLVFVIGNPGSTGRLNTIAQLEYLRDVQYPAQLAQLDRQIGAYHRLSDLDPQRAAALRNTLFGLENSRKAIGGYQSGLLDPQLMARKRQWEQAFRARVQADPAMRRQYGDAWAQVAEVRRQLAALDVRRRYSGFGAYGSRLLQLAGLIVRHPVETAKPDSARLVPFRDASRAGLERVLYSATPVDTVQEMALLTAYFEALAGELPAGDPVRKAALGARTPEAAAREMVRGSQIVTADQRRALVQGGAAAIAASSDPFIVLARTLDPLDRDIQRQVTALTDREAQQDERVARALLAVYGSTVAPDATFSLRISDGEVRRYPMNGTVAQPYTTFHGLYDRWAAFGGKAPWNLPARWVERRDSLALETPLNAASTNDIIGGNSGSPVISRDAEVVGLIFDGNIEQLPYRFLFSEERGRSVWVDCRGIIEALRRVYDAGALAEELVR